MSGELDEVWDDWNDLVNMAPKELEDWLETDRSKAAGDSDGEEESTGHASGRRIVEIKRTNKDDLTDDDVAHMKKVVGYVKRHLAQEPDKSGDDLEQTTWTASLRNWGHDPV